MSFSLLKTELSVAKQIGLFLSVTDTESTCEGKPHRLRASLFLFYYVFFKSKNKQAETTGTSPSKQSHAIQANFVSDTRLESDWG